MWQTVLKLWSREEIIESAKSCYACMHLCRCCWWWCVLVEEVEQHYYNSVLFFLLSAKYDEHNIAIGLTSPKLSRFILFSFCLNMMLLNMWCIIMIMAFLHPNLHFCMACKDREEEPAIIIVYSYCIVSSLL